MNFCKSRRGPALWTGSLQCIALSVTWMLVSGVALGAHKTEEKLPESTQQEKPAEDSKHYIAIPDHVTPLQSFQKYVESDEPNWREANDLVGEIGGWRAYAREAYLAERAEREAKEKAMEQQNAKDHIGIEPEKDETGKQADQLETQENEMNKSEGESE